MSTSSRTKIVRTPTGPVEVPISAYGYTLELDVGDAGAGGREYQYQYRNTYRAVGSDPIDMAALSDRVTFFNIPSMGGIVDECRPKFYHIRWSGRCLMRVAVPDVLIPIVLPLSDIPKYEDEVPTTLQGWIETDDGIFQIFDVIGRRGISVYARRISAGFMVSDNSYIINQKEISNEAVNPLISGISSLDYICCEAFPIIVNDSQHNDEVTVDITIGPDSEEFIIIPPGSRFVAINASTAAVADVTASFNILNGPFGIPLGSKVEITLVAGGQTPPLRIPNTPYIGLVNANLADSYIISATFTKEL